MERLTEKHFAEKGYYLKCSEMCKEMNCSFCEHDSDALDKLGEYEDAEEQGLLLRLPCKVGDTIYVIFDGRIWDGEVYHISYSDYYGEITATAWVKQGISAAFEQFGKTVFLTREEAEAALAKEE